MKNDENPTGNAGLQPGTGDGQAKAWQTQNTEAERMKNTGNPTGNAGLQPGTGDGQAEAWRTGWYTRGYLPHYEANEAIQFVSYHLADSLPSAALERLEYDLHTITETQKAIVRKERLEQLMDAGYGACYLREPAIADMVQSTFLHHNGERYRLFAWVVMPNHVHVLFQPLLGYSVGQIVASWKSFTGRRISEYIRGRARLEPGEPGEVPNCIPARMKSGEPNSLRARLEPGEPNGLPAKPEPDVSERVWHREYWDRFIRDEKHFTAAIEYIHNNPVKASLVDRIELWPWSSASESLT